MDPISVGILGMVMAFISMLVNVLLALRKEGKDEVNRKYDEFIRREKQLVDRIEACDKERNALQFTVTSMKAKQEVWELLLPKFHLVESSQGGRRNYDKPAE